MQKSLASVVGLAAVTALTTITMSGCGSSSSGTTATNVSMGAAGVDQLHTIFQQTQDSKQTLTETTTVGSGADAATQICKVQLRPTAASDCTTAGQGGSGQLRRLTLPDAVYTYQSDPDLQIGGKPWHKDPTQPASPSQPQAQAVGDGGIFTPGVGKVSAITADHVNGQACTRYDISLDFDKLIQGTLSRDNAGDPVGGTDPLAQLSSGGTASGQIWIGSDGLPLQTSVTTEFKDQPTSTQTYQYTDWGTPVTVQAPPADQVSTDTPN